jgi:hypothetical protein
MTRYNLQEHATSIAQQFERGTRRGLIEDLETIGFAGGDPLSTIYAVSIIMNYLSSRDRHEFEEFAGSVWFDMEAEREGF